MVQAKYNADGLYLKYGTSKTTPAVAGEFKTFGALHQVEIKLDLTTLGTAPAIVDDGEIFPSGARIERVDIVTETVAVGSGAVLNIGLIKLDRTTAIDADGFIAVLPTTSMDLAGETTVNSAGTTYAGSSIGLTTAFPGYITADYDTAAFTAGVIRVRIFYSVP